MRPIVDVRHADVIDGLQAMPAASVQCIATSPPYYGLRSYGIPPRTWTEGTICCFGDEPTLDLYIRHLVDIFEEMKRVLHPSGTVWLNLGDSYAGGGKHTERKEIYDIPADGKPSRPKQKGLHGKNLLMVPARAALALQAAGWIVRQDIVWIKSASFCPTGWVGSVMPESVQDRAVWSYEHVYQLALRGDYYYDIDGYREPLVASTQRSLAAVAYTGKATKDYASAKAQDPSETKRRVLAGIVEERGRNLRNAWIIPKQNFNFKDHNGTSHFAVWPEKLAEVIIRVATPEGGVCGTCLTPRRRETHLSDIPADVTAAYESSRQSTAADTGRTDGHTQRRPNHRRRVLGTTWDAGCDCYAGSIPATVLDPFCGSGRTGIVAHRLGRHFLGLDINADYVTMATNAINGGGQHDHHDRTHAESTTGGDQDAERRFEAVAAAERVV